ncbi:unnamed protein product [Fraxinus pennsylvanica]|uniref:Uncharacterized protein n=1 Tax=Fraxinus pennsylvanica TaxID=56036 RepID=A0AAD2DY19_9LAMI|nr:unnamed protein product [Fraxinus pennsylvanica]
MNFAPAMVPDDLLQDWTQATRGLEEVFDVTVMSPTILPSSHEPEDKELKELINKWPEYLPELSELPIAGRLVNNMQQDGKTSLQVTLTNCLELRLAKNLIGWLL